MTDEEQEATRGVRQGQRDQGPGPEVGAGGTARLAAPGNASESSQRTRPRGWLVLAAISTLAFGALESVQSAPEALEAGASTFAWPRLMWTGISGVLVFVFLGRTFPANWAHSTHRPPDSTESGSGSTTGGGQS